MNSSDLFRLIIGTLIAVIIASVLFTYYFFSKPLPNCMLPPLGVARIFLVVVSSIFLFSGLIGGLIDRNALGGVITGVAAGFVAWEVILMYISISPPVSCFAIATVPPTPLWITLVYSYPIIEIAFAIIGGILGSFVAIKMSSKQSPNLKKK